MSKELELARQLVKELEEKEKAGMVRLSELEAGSKFKSEIGTFIVLGNDGDETKVIMDEFYAEDARFDNNSCNYMNSDLKKLFDNEITQKFQAEFGESLVEHTVVLKSVDMQDYGAFRCKVRPITFDDAREFNDLLVNTELPDWYWTCTPWSTKERGWEYSVAVVAPSGDFNFSICGLSHGVRPFCILKSNIFVSKED